MTEPSRLRRKSRRRGEPVNAADLIWGMVADALIGAGLCFLTLCCGGNVFSLVTRPSAERPVSTGQMLIFPASVGGVALLVLSVAGLMLLLTWGGPPSWGRRLLVRVFWPFTGILLSQLVSLVVIAHLENVGPPVRGPAVVLLLALPFVLAAIASVVSNLLPLAFPSKRAGGPPGDLLETECVESAEDLPEAGSAD